MLRSDRIRVWSRKWTRLDSIQRSSEERPAKKWKIDSEDFKHKVSRAFLQNFFCDA